MLRRLLLRLYRLPEHADGRRPCDLGLASEDVQIAANDGSRLHGWYLPAARAIVGAGIPTLVIDARGHGRNGRADFMSMPRFADERPRSLTSFTNTTPDPT